MNLLLERIATSLRYIHNEKYESSEMSKGSDGLHLDGVSLVEWSV